MHKKTAIREDGAETKARLIECAGILIARKGYDRTTGKEICAMAGANPASVNYHFGGRQGLYAAVLQEVQRYIVSLKEIKDIDGLSISPRDKLKKVLDAFIHDVLFSKSWQVKVWVRCLVDPDEEYQKLVHTNLIPKFSIVGKIMSTYLGVQENDTRVWTCLTSTLSPFLFYIISREGHFGNLVEELLRPGCADEQVALMKAFSYAGLRRMKDLIAEQQKESEASSGK